MNERKSINPPQQIGARNTELVPPQIGLAISSSATASMMSSQSAAHSNPATNSPFFSQSRISKSASAVGAAAAAAPLTTTITTSPFNILYTATPNIAVSSSQSSSSSTAAAFAPTAKSAPMILNNSKLNNTAATNSASASSPHPINSNIIHNSGGIDIFSADYLNECLPGGTKLNSHSKAPPMRPDHLALPKSITIIPPPLSLLQPTTTQQQHLHPESITPSTNSAFPPSPMKEPMAMQQPIRSSNLEATFTILKYYLSVGILTLPSMFYLTGYVLGAVLVITITILTGHSVSLIHDVNVHMWEVSPEDAKINVNLAFGEMVLRVLGERGRFIFRVFSMISNIGACLAYIIFFEMYIEAILHQQFSHRITDDQAHLIGALIAFIVILPLSTINNVALFFQTNFIGLFLCVTALLLMLYRDFTLILSTGSLSATDHPMWKFENFTLALGITVYSFKIVGISMTIRNNMAEPLHFRRVFFAATGITGFTYLFFGIVTQLALGQYAADVALMNFAPQTGLGFVVRLTYIVSVLLSYPLKFYVVIMLYENFAVFKDNIFSMEAYEKKKYASRFLQQLALLKRYAVRFGLIVVVFMVTLTSVRFSKLLSFVGSLGGIVNQFVIPQLIYLTYFKNSLSDMRKYVGYTLIAFCVVASFFGAIRSATELFDTVRSPDSPQESLIGPIAQKEYIPHYHP